ncbi:hypothetical protein PSY47_23420, partial [Shigella flexneri]|nr:hypothetical protein [Shigella flexneri]
ASEAATRVSQMFPSGLLNAEPGRFRTDSSSWGWLSPCHARCQAPSGVRQRAAPSSCPSSSSPAALLGISSVERPSGIIL